MPTVTSDFVIDMNDFSRARLAAVLQAGQSVSTSATQAVINALDPDGYAIQLIFTGTGLGGFTARGVPTTGTITGFRIEQSGDLVLGLAGLSVSASALNAVLAGSDDAAFWNLLYGGADTITGAGTWGVANSLYGHGGNDTINGGSGGDLLSGGAGDDVITGGDEIDPSGASYGDGIDGGAGADTLRGGVGRDVLVGGDGADLIEGDAGNDILYHDGDGLTSGETVLQLGPEYGNMAIPVRFYLAADRRAEDGSVDTLNGGAGDDFIYLGAGDSADGGDGADSVEVNFRGRNSALTLDMTAGAAAAITAVAGGSFANVERFDVVGTLFNDIITGGAESTILYGEAGEDRIDGGAGNDSIAGSAFTNSSRIGNVWGSRFDDGQRDELFGGEGNDAVSVGLLDYADGGAGGDSLLVSLDGLDEGVSIEFSAGFEFDILALVTGGTYVNFETISALHTTEYRDVIRSIGITSIHTFGGDDLVYAGDANNTVSMGDGDDVAYAMGGIDLVFGGFGDDRLYGGAGSDTLYADIDYDPNQAAGSGADFLDGGEGNDTLYGGAGDDVLVGGAGGDRIYGEGGTDTVSYDGSTVGVSVQRSPNGSDPQTGLQAWTYFASGGDAQGDMLDGVEGIIGSGQNDTLTGFGRADGAGGADTIEGSHLADILLGGAGDDTLRGLDGADTLNGGEGNDIVGYSRTSSGAGTVGVTVDLRIQGVAQDTGHGSDTLISVEGVVGSIHADVLHGDDQANYIQGAGDGSLPGSGPYQGDQLFGHGGDDVIVGDGAAAGLGYTPGDGVSRGYDLISGGDGNDTITAGNGADVVTGDAGDDIIFGEWDADTLDGGAGNDKIDGGSMNDIITGGDGNDRLTGGSGADALDGGAGTDTAVFSGVRADYAFAFLPGGELQITGPDGVDVLTNVERLQFSDGLFDPNGHALPTEILGTPNADTLNGTAGRDDIQAGAGDDLITGGGDNDTIDGGAGFDTAVFSDGPAGVVSSNGVGVTGLDGSDSLTNVERLRFGTTDLLVSALLFSNSVGSSAGETLIGSSSFEGLFGLGGDDTLNAFDGDDTLAGGAGVDVLNGGNGFDTADYTSAAAGVTARLDTMRSTNDGDGGTDTFTSIEAITGSAFNDLLVGGALGDTLKGGLGADTLLGQGGNDVLWGGAGAGNTLQGGLGDDRYVLEALDSVVEVDGQGTDTVEARINAYNLANNVENLIYTGAGNFSGTGNALNNVMTGGAGDDLLRGRGGVDTLVGGGGIDTADYSQAAAGVHARLDNMRAVNDGDGSTDTFTSIEAILGSAFNDTLVGGALGDRLSGGLGADTLLGFAGNDILAGGQGLANQLQGGLGDDLYVLDAYDTIVEIAGQGHDTIEAHVGAHVMAANIEDMFYVGNNKFYGTGNAGNNTITSGIGDDILKGMGGSDRLFGGAGYDEVHVRGTQAQYTVTTEGSGWRIVDTVAGRDGTIYVESIEAVRFLTGNTKTVLTYTHGAAAPEPSAKDAGPLVSPLQDDDAFVLPALADKAGPLVLPVQDDLAFDGADAGGGMETGFTGFHGFGDAPLFIGGMFGPHIDDHSFDAGSMRDWIV
ncbi:beta strand repeat-containing protein [Brevundimonas lenta]|uniref:Ca2+-binding RTX toxin-like protein n=1 Tax=Brevundimonas lenta TaxID=424796 RepID=A0A7W6JCY4_9CAUL|nr:calcium-binding protein [Brevundimonas lenta]MBB4082851.1 Ca2+-binding RTX toxin-like protein [Brevundimonas lenta]